MKKLKVSIQDENTLILQENGSRGDLIDLRSLHDTDIDKTTITSVVNSIKQDAFNEEVRRVTEAHKREMELEMQIKEKDIHSESKKALEKLESDISELKAELKTSDSVKELAITKAVSNAEKERDSLKLELSNQEKEKELLKKSHDMQVQDFKDSLDRLKDWKAKQSIKLVGENLEQHCQNEFNSVRSSMFPFAYFDKDNEAVEGTKGDYIYRDYESKDGTEIISVMFEMKDEQEESENKKKVEDHLKKLDSDRTKKNCEYAILVTTLEADNELYNRGIVNLSYKYEKMLVIRPQFFLPLILMLKDLAMKSAEDRRQLALARNSNVDLENFVENVENWKSSWGGTMKNAAKKHSDAIDQIDKAIKDLMKARDALTTSDKHLLAAENKLDDLTVRRLTKNAPSVAERLKDQEK